MWVSGEDFSEQWEPDRQGPCSGTCLAKTKRVCDEVRGGGRGGMGKAEVREPRGGEEEAGLDLTGPVCYVFPLQSWEQRTDMI